MSFETMKLMVEIYDQVGHSQKVRGADYVLESIHNIKEAIPELWKSDRKTEVAYPTKIAVETSVIA